MSEVNIGRLLRAVLDSVLSVDLDTEAIITEWQIDKVR